MTVQLAIMLIIYIGILMLFAWYSFINVKQTKQIEEWNESTEHYVDSLKNRITDLDVRLKKIEHDLGMQVIEPEPDFHVKEEKR